MKKIRKYFLGDLIADNVDVFERSRAIMLLNFSLMFIIIMFIALINDYIYGFDKLILIHAYSFVSLSGFLFIIKYQQNLDKSINLFFLTSLFINSLSNISLNPTNVYSTIFSWNIFFITLSALLQRGKTRIIFCCFLLWLPVLYAYLNKESNGQLTIPLLLEKDITMWPLFSILPIILSIYAIWNHTTTIRYAQKLLVKQKLTLSEKNKDIIDSINYAKRIQDAQLPMNEEIIAALPQSFILFKPKDIVSGDFYFFHKTNQTIFIAAADCTGHGIPGAFMSIIGSEKLNDAVSQSTNPSEILQLLNNGIKKSLHQTSSDESTRDGMDIAFCTLDLKEMKLKYAGANRPLWIIAKEQNEIKEIKATNKAIGGLTDDDQHFETHEIKLQKGDAFYIFTDGYADTFGGVNNKKLTSKKFKETLLSIQGMSMKEQEKHLSHFIESWKAGTEQMDDILVIGVKV